MAAKMIGAPLQGLQGLYPDPQDTQDMMDEGVLEAKANALHPDHGTYGSQAIGYSGTVPMASPFSNIQAYDGGATGDDYSPTEVIDSDGSKLDYTPTSHAAPYPRGIIQPDWSDPDAYAGVGDQLQALHGPDLGGQRFYVEHSPSGRENPVDIPTERYESPDNIVMGAEIGQLKGGHPDSGSGHGAGNADVVQGYGQANLMPEFAHGHSIRYVQHDRMPFDFTNTHGEQDVPFMGRHPVQQMPFDGPDSPYFEAGSIDGANTPWEGRIGDPTEYVQPPEVTVLPAHTNYSEDVWAYAG